MDISSTTAKVVSHLEGFFGRSGVVTAPERERLARWCDDFRVVEIQTDSAYVYASAGICTARAADRRRHEFVIRSRAADPSTLKALLLVCYWHVSTDAGAHVGSTLNLEEPWFAGSKMTRVLISLPYPFGPKFEHVALNGDDCSFRWILPIHDQESSAVKRLGLEAVEAEFERRGIEFDDPQRLSVF